jgi:hypothetical protein
MSTLIDRKDSPVFNIDKTKKHQAETLYCPVQMEWNTCKIRSGAGGGEGGGEETVGNF